MWVACRDVHHENIRLAASPAADCQPSPIPVKIGNVTLANKQIAWGAEISVGTPPQNFAFLPQWPLNNLMAYGSGKCEDAYNNTIEACETFRGGRYKNLDSATCRPSPADLHPGEDSRYPADKAFYTGTLKLNEDASVAAFPFFVPGSNYHEQAYTPLMAVGLGNDSTVLRTLRRAGRIGSRTWSLFAGLAGGTDVGLLAPADRLTACLDPSAPRVMGLDPHAAAAQPEKRPEATHETADPARFEVHEAQGNPVVRGTRSELA